MNYLVTGSTGNLARHIVARLISGGDEVLQVDLREPDDSGGRFEQADITDHARIDELVAGFAPQRIIHMASLLSMTSEAQPDLAWRVNATASVALLESAARHGVGQVFYPSTGATYSGTLPDPLPEDYPQWPANIYGVTKVAVERAGAYFAARRGVDFRSVRLPMVISPYAPTGAVSAYASHAFAAAVRGERFTFPVEPSVGISTIYVADVVDGILRLLDAPESSISRRVYNLHGFAPSAGDIANAIADRVPGFSYEFAPQEINMQVLGPMPTVHEDASARREWGWEPRFGLEQCADDMIRAAREAARDQPNGGAT
ncbi:MAG: NAD-dependent epimerase/dehydratase family protein [Spirochaetota bacterium]